MARLIEAFVGHQRQVDHLFSLTQSGRLPHASLFVGPEGIGKFKLALAIAQLLVCESKQSGCGQCGSCLRVAKQQSESVFIIKPDMTLSKPVIKIEEIRGLLDRLSLASMGGARVVIVDQANCLNPQASNALLKTLEEPTDNVFFILNANDVDGVLPTIRSRVQITRFQPLSVSELTTIFPQLPTWMYVSARGQAGRLKALSTEEGVHKREESLELLQLFLLDREFLHNKSWREALKDRGYALANIQNWIIFVRDVLFLKLQNGSQSSLLNSDLLEGLKSLNEVSNKKLSQLSERLVQAERDLAGNVDSVLLMEEMWVRYARMD